MALKDPNKSSIRGSTRVLQGFYKDSIEVQDAVRAVLRDTPVKRTET